MRAFVTGADGFAGRWLCAHLDVCGDEVIPATEIGGFELRDPQRVREMLLEAQPEVVFHLAGQNLVGESWKYPADTFEVNAMGTLHLLDAALACDVPPTVVLSSSSEVYGHPDEALIPVREDHPLAPVNPFAASKVAAEYLGLQAHLGTRLPVVRVRMFSNIGPDQAAHFVAPSLAYRIIAASKTATTSLAVGNLDTRRDYLDIRDAVRAHRLLAEHGEPGVVYNLCSGSAVSVREMATKLLDEANIDLDLLVDPSLVRPREVSTMKGDPTLITEVTGWKPEIRLDQTLRDVLRHCREQSS